MINHVVTDLITMTTGAIQATAPASIDAVRTCGQPLVSFSDAVTAEHLALKRYLRDHVYRHYRVLRMTNKAQQVSPRPFRHVLR